MELLPDPGSVPSGQRLDRELEAEVQAQTQAEPEKNGEGEERQEPGAAEMGRVRSPMALDGAICITFVLLFGLLCRHFA